MTRDDWKELERDLSDPKVRNAMRGRCEEQEHQFENRMDATFATYQGCKWCGAKRNYRGGVFG